MDREALLDTIKRLLALGKSPNEHEAAAALAKAAQLMELHHIAQADLPAEGSWDEASVASYARRKPRAAMYVCSVLQKHFGVVVSSHDPADCRRYQFRGSITLFGDAADVAVAVYVFHFLRDTFERLARRHRIAAALRESFYDGLHDGLCAKLREAQQARDGQGRALSLARRATALAEKRRRFREAVGCDMPTAAESRRQPDFDRATYALGHGEGSNIEIHPAIRESQATARERLGQDVPLIEQATLKITA
ncbi:MAG: DUF2786 domain-containing protein [Pirellulales bacterium]